MHGILLLWILAGEAMCIYVFIYVKVVHGREFLGGPCNEVHGTILVMDTSQ